MAPILGVLLLVAVLIFAAYPKPTHCITVDLGASMLSAKPTKGDILLKILPSNEIQLQNQPVSLDMLYQSLKETHAANPKIQLFMDIDPQTPHDIFVKTLATVKRSEMQIATIVTKPDLKFWRSRRPEAEKLKLMESIFTRTD